MNKKQPLLHLLRNFPSLFGSELDQQELGFNIRIRKYPDNPVIILKLSVSVYFFYEYPNNIRIYPSNS